MPLHWHPNGDLGCISVRCLTGHIRVYVANDHGSVDNFGGPGTGSVTFKPGQRVTWCSASTSRSRRACTEDWSVEFVVADQSLYRNVSIDARV